MSKKRSKMKITYLLVLSTFISERDGTQKPQCLLYDKVLANASMKPSKLQEHLMSDHPAPANASDNVNIFREEKA
ncbi:UNVERIFIED_CONTAM: hypothetical protein RMT77_006206 [Armadillidium vulgare]